MMEENAARKVLLTYLLKKGYPAESLSTTWNSDADMWYTRIIDPRTRELVAIIAMKTRGVVATSKPAYDAIKEFSIIIKKNVGFFFVDIENNLLNISQFVQNSNNFADGEFIPLLEVPEFKILKENSLGKKRKDTQSKIECTCWSAAIILTIIFFLDLFGCISITAKQQSLILIVIALILIPFASKIKIFNIEFERVTEK